MSVTISIRFLTGRVHLHPWQTHHSEGRVEWPPSPWRLLRAFVAVAGRGLTSLPYPDDVPLLKHEAVVNVEGMAKPKERGVPPETKKKLSFSKPKQTLTLKAPLTDAEVDAWKAANPGEEFAAALDQLQELAAAPDPVAMGDFDSDEIPLSRLAELLHALSTTPTIWLPKTSGGHTRQYFPIHAGGMVKNTGSAVFDTFATVRKDQPLLFHWPNSNLSKQQLADLRLLLSRMTYFGRAESWCQASAHTCQVTDIPAEGMCQIVPEKTHWDCRCIEDHGKPAGQEYREYLLERRLAPISDIKNEVPELLPRTNSSDGKKRKQADADTLRALLTTESEEKLLLRCLLRESGLDIKDGLERPIGTRWVHYAVPRTIHDVPRAKPKSRPRIAESVDLVRYALNTATIGRAVLPAVTDTLLVADKFRSAVMALCRQPSVALSGHVPDGPPCKDHQHAYWWPMDEDNDGFIDYVLVWAPGGFEQPEIDALRRLTRLRQRGGRPDLLVTPTYVGQAACYPPWQSCNAEDGPTVFVSATPYFCPVHLSHGRGKSGRIRSLKAEVIKGLRLHGLIEADHDVFDISEIVFDYAADELISVHQAIESASLTEPVPPRQYFPVIESPDDFPPLPTSASVADIHYPGAVVKDADEGYCFGNAIGLSVDDGSRFIRALSFCRRRRGHEVRGRGRMLQITFANPRLRQPFAIGDQCHFGLGLFTSAFHPLLTSTDVEPASNHE
jgi:CRISPR-associated protein Csb2